MDGEQEPDGLCPAGGGDMTRLKALEGVAAAAHNIACVPMAGPLIEELRDSLVALRALDALPAAQPQGETVRMAMWKSNTGLRRLMGETEGCSAGWTRIGVVELPLVEDGV